MKATQLEQGKFQSSVFKLCQELGESGADVLVRIDGDEKFRARIAEYMLAGAPSRSVTTFRMAKAIMGDESTIGPEQVKSFFGFEFEQKAFDKAEYVPYKLETLARCRDTHLLVFGIPMTVRDISNRSQIGMSWSLPDVGGEPAIVTSFPTSGWFLINRNSSKILGEGERLATFVEAYYALSLHKETNKRHYFFRSYAICQETPAGGEVYFGLISQRFSYNYHAAKEVTQPIDDKVVVVMPDNPID